MPVLRTLRSLAGAAPRRAVHADHVLRLHVVGRVQGADGKPLSGAELVFLDVGLDDHRSDDPEAHAHTMGASGKRGAVDLRHRYRWGRTTEGDAPGPSGGTFGIRIEHDDHAAVTVTLDTDALPQEGRTLKVDLGTVALPRG